MVLQYVIIALLALAVIAVVFLIVCVRMLLVKQDEAVRALEDIKITFAGEFKELSKVLTDALTEAKQTNRHLSEQLALKEAEMTGDFEIVEEPVLPTPAVKEPKLKNRSGKSAEAKLTPPPQSFPKIG